LNLTHSDEEHAAQLMRNELFEKRAVIRAQIDAVELQFVAINPFKDRKRGLPLFDQYITLLKELLKTYGEDL